LKRKNIITKHAKIRNCPAMYDVYFGGNRIAAKVRDFCTKVAQTELHLIENLI